jgi:hypothetical protein
VLVLGTVAYEQQEARRSQALDEAVEQRLSLAVDPVEVLEDHEEGLLSGFPQQQPLHGVERALATCSRVERLPRGVVRGHVEQGQQRRQRRLQGFVQGEQLAHHLLPDLAQVVPVLDLEVALEEVDHGQVACRLAVRDRGALDGEPALQAVGVGELVESGPEAGDSGRSSNWSRPSVATTSSLDSSRLASATQKRSNPSASRTPWTNARRRSSRFHDACIEPAMR